jgi:hypothetical protein
MVAGDTRRVVVIKNISSNLIEEAILILRNEPGVKDGAGAVSSAVVYPNVKNDLLLREAENIINQYIKDNGLKCGRKRKWPQKEGRLKRIFSVNTIINCLLISAVAFLIWVVSRIF